jgi:alginate O-acetyltransferase complex protein AlgF
MIARNAAAATAFALLAGVATPAALAQDGGLYPDPGAPDASFVRVIAPDANGATIDGQDVDFTEVGVSPYVEVSPGSLVIAGPDGDSEVEVGANTHYTFAGGTLIEDAVKDSPAQADLLLYNLSDHASVDLYAVEADTLALSGVEQGAHSGVGLKAPLTLTFEVRDGDTTLAALEPVDLRRGTGTTVVVSGSGDAVTAGAMTSTYAE